MLNFLRNSVFALTAACSLTGAAGAQDFTRMDISGMYNQQVQANNQYFQNQTQNIVSQNMQNPAIQAAYRNYQAQGGGMNFAQFCYAYGATGGFTQQGMANWQNNEQMNRAREQNAWAGYQQAQAARARAQSAYADGYRRNQAEAGRNLNGQATYYGPGGAQVLPYTGGPGTYQNGQGSYYQAPNGTYYQVMPNGWGVQMNQWR